MQIADSFNVNILTTAMHILKKVWWQACCTEA